MELVSYFICTFLPVIKNSSKTRFFNLSLSIVVSSSFTTIYLSNIVFLDFQGFFCVFIKRVAINAFCISMFSCGHSRVQ